MTDLVIRPLNAGEEHLFESLPDAGLVGPAAFGRTYKEAREAGMVRPDWTWVALRDGVVVARAAWTGGPEDSKPLGLVWYDFSEVNAAVQLLATVPLRTEYCLSLPPGWRDVPEVRSAAEARLEAAQAAGLKPLVERYRYEWRPECGLPDRPGRLEFRPEPDDGAILDLLRRIHHGTLDAHARKTIASAGIEGAALKDMETLRWFPGPRDWWRVGYTREGSVVGLTLPSRNLTDPVVALIAVVPEQRGHGYAYDLLVECTQILVAEGVDRIIADTDRTNTPMAATFARAGYPITQERVFLT